jgi:hypothetical protein
LARVKLFGTWRTRHIEISFPKKITKSRSLVNAGARHLVFSESIEDNGFTLWRSQFEPGALR